MMLPSHDLAQGTGLLFNQILMTSIGNDNDEFSYVWSFTFI
jgi:hypothetical protein